jgi:predicted benzoate:H+ symporter BenE
MPAVATDPITLRSGLNATETWTNGGTTLLFETGVGIVSTGPVELIELLGLLAAVAVLGVSAVDDTPAELWRKGLTVTIAVGTGTVALPGSVKFAFWAQVARSTPYCLMRILKALEPR